MNFKIVDKDGEESCKVTLQKGVVLELFTDSEGLHIESNQGRLAVMSSAYHNGLLIFSVVH